MRIVIVETGTSDVDGEMREELLTWARGIGLDTKLACTAFVLAEEPAGSWTAHFSMKQQRDGRDRILPGTNRVATDYGSVALPAPKIAWPRWFDQPDEVPDIPFPALLEALDVAAASRSALRSFAYRRDRMEAYR